ncbi:MAG TPA: TetR/AcrR family transcriptional regulator [Acidimicrobiales bacterium]|nr:TetR/AcrR family transcriptional regulator [Acidimicrobiales bacterium]
MSQQMPELLHDAALACISRYGVAKTNLDDVAAEAGVSRASAYRAYPGGKQALLESVFAAEVAGVVQSIHDAIGPADDLGRGLAAGITAAARRIASIEAVRFVLRYEPELVLPHLSFAGLDRFLSTASAALAPAITRWLDPSTARHTAELCVRLFVSHWGNPDPRVRLTDPDQTLQLVEDFVLPTITRKGSSNHGNDH